ncbi:ABC transporter ATP-binding protein [Maritimibacter fusiformis]|uniref:ABC transporter ATP-binding protein n=1 Tax=Maritimibacter fusiformis TaxID=2603819 RepID=A0A5D0RKE8_9RHOB|nr:ABC transporter ATP-binding protein [Maritimibacter fusiformis]TYB81128.1 ABC transporter ATP-binding protein [Maritimibacter fusiformis]
MSAPEDIVVIEGMTKNFGSGDATQKVLKGIDLSLAKGSLAALQGRSGSGKSTLLSILGTLMKPTAGQHEMLGQDLGRISERDLTEFRNRHIGFVFQFHHLFPDLTALENVMFPSAMHMGRETRAARRRAADLLVRVGLEDRIGFRATALSGGQKQRVAIARALMNTPELVLADEPTGNLDRESADQVMDLVREINAEDHTTFLISTHDEKIADGCRRQIHLDDGQIVASAPPAK